MKATKRNRCKQIEYNGKSQTMSEWARNLGLSNSAFKRRLDLWGLEEAMARPHGASGPKSVNEKG